MDTNDLNGALHQLKHAFHLDTPMTVGIISLVTAGTVYAIARWARSRARERARMSSPRLLPTDSHQAADDDDHAAKDTVLVVPDISGYTRFLATTSATPDVAKNIILSLLDAIIDAVGQHLKVAKIEGDAVLLFTDEIHTNPHELAATVQRIFTSFDMAKLSAIQNSDNDVALSDLDLKIFVHHGAVSRFRFRNEIDLMGTDVVLLHRLMKNDVSERRYVMVTKNAEAKIRMPPSTIARRSTQQITDIGQIETTVYAIPPSLPQATSMTGTIDERSDHTRDEQGRLPPTMSIGRRTHVGVLAT